MTGDQADIVARLRAVVPARWFPQPNSDGTTNTPILDGVLNGLANAWAAIYAILAYVRLQTRIATATDANLDMIAADFFGPNLIRFVNEGDAPFSARIRATILQPKVTRAAVIAAVKSLTGRTPIVFEPADTGDTGAYTSTAGSFYSQAVGVVGQGWGNFGAVTVVQNAATDPNGGSTASEIELASGSGNGVYGGNISLSGGQTARFGMWMRAVSGTMTARLLVSAVTVQTLTCFLTTSWQWFEIVYTAPSATTANIQIDNGAGSGNLYAWGASINAAAWSGMAYGAAGGWGSMQLPFQAFLTAYRPSGGGVANVGGYYAGSGWAGGGYGVGAIQYITDSMIEGEITDAAIYATIAATQPAGSIIWTKIEN